jgi:anthranilate phosphoribosyltransferase
MARMKDILEALASGRDLEREEAALAFGLLMGGELSPAQAGALLMGLRIKSETAQELAGAVDECLRKARLVPGLSGRRIDTCGTGGDGQSSFNCSTATALMLAAMGYNVVKHGNRSVSSTCGSADVVEALGLPLDTGPEDVADELARTNFVFLFAPAYHPAFKHVMPVRKDLGMRTLFNLMGPLLNPARPTHQIVGVPRPELVPLVAEVLALSGLERGVVVHGARGFDELTPFGPSQVCWIRDGEVTPGVVDPAPLGLMSGGAKDVAVADPGAALGAVKDLLSGIGPLIMQNMLILNLAVALVLLEDMPLEQAVHEAGRVFMEGETLNHFGIEYA